MLGKKPPRLRELQWQKVDEVRKYRSLVGLLDNNLSLLKSIKVEPSQQRQFKDFIDLLESFYIPLGKEFDAMYNINLIHEYFAYYQSQQRKQPKRES